MPDTNQTPADVSAPIVRYTLYAAIGNVYRKVFSSRSLETTLKTAQQLTARCDSWMIEAEVNNE